MSHYISSNTLYLPFLGQMLDYVPSARAQCIMCVESSTGTPIAGVAYDGYNGHIIMAHIWVDKGRRPSKEWIAAIFDYPFNKLMVRKIVGQVRSSNTAALELDKHFGFEPEARIENFYSNGDSLEVLTMAREQCMVLNSLLWVKTLDKVSGI
jgi:RimJ/RimL family protein N-acetyltransferase